MSWRIVSLHKGQATAALFAFACVTAGSVGCAGVDASDASARASTRSPQEAQVVEPGSELIDTDRIEPFYADAGRFNVAFRHGSLGDEEVFNVETRLLGAQLPSMDYMAADRRTFGLRMRNSAYLAFGGHQLTMIVEGSRARGALVPYADTAAIPFDVELEFKPFEEFLLGWVLATLPLETEASFRLPTVAPVRDGGPFKIRWYETHVVRIESRASHRGGDDVSTWVVDFTADDGTSEGTFWIADVPPYVIRREQTSGGRTSTMEFLSVERLR